MADRPFDKVKAGLEAAVAFVQGDTSGCVVHTSESILLLKKERHRERANLWVVPNPPAGKSGDDDGEKV